MATRTLQPQDKAAKAKKNKNWVALTPNYRSSKSITKPIAVRDQMSRISTQEINLKPLQTDLKKRIKAARRVIARCSLAQQLKRLVALEELSKKSKKK